MENCYYSLMIYMFNYKDFEKTKQQILNTKKKHCKQLKSSDSSTINKKYDTGTFITNISWPTVNILFYNTYSIHI